MIIYNKIVVSTTEPKEKIVLWYDPSKQDIFWYNDGWTSLTIFPNYRSIEQYVKEIKDAVQNLNLAEYPYIIEENKKAIESINVLLQEVSCDIDALKSKTAFIGNESESTLFYNEHQGSFVAGKGCVAEGQYSFAEGYHNITNNNNEHAQGSYNKSNANTLHSVGIGTSESDRKNAFEIANDGKVYIKDVGGYDGTNPSDENDVVSALKNVGSSIIHVTYDELVTLKSQSKLIPGQQYRITDYVTTTTTFNTQSTGYTFDIIVQAVSNGKLSEDAKACLCTYNLLIDVIDENGDVCTAVKLLSNLTGRVQYLSPTGYQFSINWLTTNRWVSPTEIKGADNKVYISDDAKRIYSYLVYFKNSNFEAWEIKYSLTNDTTRFAWAASKGKGVIYYMKDEFGNEAGYDFKNIQFKNLRRFSDSFVSKSNEDKIVDVEALDFSNNTWFTSDSVIMQTESNYKYTFSKGTTDASLNSQCRYNVIENTENASENTTKQYLPFVVLESDTGAIHGNKCLQCPINIYIHVSGQIAHNTFDLHCKNVYICGDHLYDSYFSALLRMAFRGYTWDTYVQSCEDWVVWSSSHCKNNHFKGVCQKYKIVCTSMQNVHVSGTSNVITSLMPNAYLLAITIYPYSTNITFTGNATWVERFTFMGSRNLTLNIDSGKVYSSIFYSGDYADKTITEFNRTESNADTGVTYEYKPNNSKTIMV